LPRAEGYPRNGISRSSVQEAMSAPAENARNEAFFRAVNEGIAEASEKFESTEAEFLCECGDPRCTYRIEVSLDEYEAVREHPTRFLVRRGHALHEIEEVVRRHKRYAIVDKVDRVASAVARRLNPRPRPSRA
jgi:hypothetical protein